MKKTIQQKYAQAFVEKKVNRREKKMVALDRVFSSYNIIT